MPLPAQALASTPRRFTGSVWVLLAGVLLGLSIPPTGFYPLAWVALVPLIVRWSQSRSAWESFSDAYGAFLAMSVVAGYWTLLHQEIPRAMIAGGLLMTLPVLLALPFVAGFLVRQHTSTTTGFVTLVASSLLTEHVLGQHVVPLPWIQLGHTQLESLVLIQVASLSGVSALSLWLWLVGGVAAWALLAPHYFQPVFTNRTVALLVLGLVFACPFLYGAYALERDKAGLRSVRVGLVQPAMTPQEWLYSDPAERIDHLASLSESLMAERRTSSSSVQSAHALDVLVWPELSLPAYTETARTNRLYRRVAAWTQRHGVTLLTGAAIQSAGAARFNSALLFGPGQAPQRSDQTSAHPAFDGARFVEPPVTLSQGDPDWRLAQPDYPFEPSMDKALLATQHGTLVPLIGFESLYSERTRQHALGGGDVLVVLAQNDWWGRLPSSHLHYAMMRLLAVEHRRPVIVSTVNGTMGMVLPSGRGVERRPDAGATAAHTVRFSAVDSPYLRYGNLVVRFSLFCLFGIAVVVAVRTTILPRRVRAVPPPTAVMDYDDDQPDTYRPTGLAWPDTPTAYEDDADPLGGAGLGGDGLAGDGHGRAVPPGNLAASSRVPQASSSPAAPWSASPSPSSSPPAPPAGSASSAPWASPSRFASPVTPKSSRPTSPPTKP